MVFHLCVVVALLEQVIEIGGRWIPYVNQKTKKSWIELKTPSFTEYIQWTIVGKLMFVAIPGFYAHHTLHITKREGHSEAVAVQKGRLDED